MSAPPSRRHSRRSTGGSINFSSMSFSPLTSATLTPSDFSTQRQRPHTRRSASYIQSPSTPSATVLTPTPSRTATTPPIPKSRSVPRLNSSAEWLHRTADALTSGAREAKGQAWLTTRASSTSLVAEDDDDHDAQGDRERERANERALSPMWGAAEEEDYMAAGYARGGVGEGVGVEVGVEQGEWEEEDEAVGGVYRLGQIIDRLIGWSVFGEDDSDTEDEEEKRGEKEKEKERVKERERLRIAGPEEERLREEQRRRRDMDDGWQDPAWLFSIASNVLF